MMLHSSGRALSPWDLGVLALLAVIGCLYVIGGVRLARRGGVHRGWERLAFGAGWFALVATALPPLDALAVQLFSAHMAQHELMMLVGAPLVIAGRPLPVLLGGLPERARRRAASVLQSRPLSGGWRVLSTPLVAWVLHGVVLWLWHVPVLYELAVREEGVHVAQHAMFVGTAALFWWGVLYGRYGRAGYGAAVFYVFTTVVHTGLLGAALAVSGAPYYPGYVSSSSHRGVDPLEDQQLAGLIMWIPAGLVLTLLGIGLFAAWLGEAERRVDASRRHRRHGVDSRSAAGTLNGPTQEDQPAGSTWRADRRAAIQRAACHRDE
jgi:putative membrane protein